MYTTLIEPTELLQEQASANPGSTDWVIVDCRFDLAKPDWGAASYAAGHVPNALYAHLDHDLSGPLSSATGRHPLPSMIRLAETLGRWGIDEDAQVVAYDQGGGAYAARLWWLLRWAGHPRVAVLNGGYAAWQQAALPIEVTSRSHTPRTFTLRPSDEQVMGTAELERLLHAGELANGKAVLVDARGADRFAGENETIDPVAGHIPGAHNHPFASNLGAHGRFLSASELRSRWEATLGEHPARDAIAMCGSGVTACHNLLAMAIAGLSGARLYAGSWSEWIRDRTRPVARSGTAAAPDQGSVAKE